MINHIERRLLAGEEFSDEELNWPEALQHVKSSVNIEVVGIVFHSRVPSPYDPATHKNGGTSPAESHESNSLHHHAADQLDFVSCDSFAFPVVS